LLFVRSRSNNYCNNFRDIYFNSCLDFAMRCFVYLLFSNSNSKSFCFNYLRKNLSLCYELIKAILVVWVLRLASELAIMFDMLEERTSWAWCSTCSTNEHCEQPCSLCSTNEQGEQSIFPLYIGTKIRLPYELYLTYLKFWLIVTTIKLQSLVIKWLLAWPKGVYKSLQSINFSLISFVEVLA